ncbi:hypothetical protein IE53DRAFT_287648 [Violaceomyces palustris]|uniref:Uncharacterized protein n=1 Tax=Violaceomyces palustris TaxID=1673888 RepID=A0ACD0NM01_9BASI|nr:hypothetical protein IE53DRAFT_287648 [Violaceomyces palustris]
MGMDSLVLDHLDSGLVSVGATTPFDPRSLFLSRILSSSASLHPSTMQPNHGGSENDSKRSGSGSGLYCISLHPNRSELPVWMEGQDHRHRTPSFGTTPNPVFVSPHVTSNVPSQPLPPSLPPSLSLSQNLSLSPDPAARTPDPKGFVDGGTHHR